MVRCLCSGYNESRSTQVEPEEVARDPLRIRFGQLPFQDFGINQFAISWQRSMRAQFSADSSDSTANWQMVFHSQLDQCQPHFMAYLQCGCISGPIREPVDAKVQWQRLLCLERNSNSICLLSIRTRTQCKCTSKQTQAKRCV